MQRENEQNNLSQRSSSGFYDIKFDFFFKFEANSKNLYSAIYGNTVGTFKCNKIIWGQSKAQTDNNNLSHISKEIYYQF